jgi:hypothetical protein
MVTVAVLDTILNSCRNFFLNHFPKQVRDKRKLCWRCNYRQPIDETHLIAIKKTMNNSKPIALHHTWVEASKICPKAFDDTSGLHH